METTPSIDLKDLRRDWINGLSGEDFYALVRVQLDLFSTDEEAKERGILLAEGNPVRFAAAFFAGLTLHLPLVLANPNWGSNELDEMATLVNPAVVVGDLRFDTNPRQGISHPQSGEILIPTGGTTGGVKLAVHDLNSLLVASRGVFDLLGGDPIDSCCLLPLHHVSGLMQLVRSFATGGKIRFDDKVIEGYCISLVPTQLQRLIMDEVFVERLRLARAVFVGGAAMPEPLVAQLRELRLPVIPVYGMTETAAMVAAVPAEDFLNKENPGALPLGGAEINMDSDGGICVQTPALFKGYHGCVPTDFSSGFRTGDLGHLDDEGGLHVLGRMDGLINTGGEKVDPAEVEQSLLCIPGINAAQVVGEPDEEWGQVVVAYLQGDESLDLETVRGQLKQVLGSYKVPKRFEWVHPDQHLSG